MPTKKHYNFATIRKQFVLFVMIFTLAIAPNTFAAESTDTDEIPAPPDEYSLNDISFYDPYSPDGASECSTTDTIGDGSGSSGGDESGGGSSGGGASSGGSIPSNAPRLSSSIPIKDRKGILETTGMIVSSSYYGGRWQTSPNGSGWYSTNKLQGAVPGARADDPGIGNRSNNLPGKAWFAELSNPGTRDFSALGRLPNGTKLQITFQGKTIVAEHGDVGTGNGRDLKGVDLWWEGAALLNYKGAGDLYVKIVDKNTPTTPVPSVKKMSGYSMISADDGGNPSSTPGTGGDSGGGGSSDTGNDGEALSSCVDTGDGSGGEGSGGEGGEGGSGGSGGGSGGTGPTGFVNTVKGYVKPDFHAKPYTGASNAMPEYVKAADAARSQGLYVGNGAKPYYADCGGFVTLLIRNSGFDPRYNNNGKGGNTPVQRKWVQDNWRMLGRGGSVDVATLQPGDVWIRPGHTFVYIGNVPGINSNRASASNRERVPMAGKESLTDSKGEWYRRI